MLILSTHFTQPKMHRFCVLLTRLLQPIRIDLNAPKRKPDLLLFQKVVAFLYIELNLNLLKGGLQPLSTYIGSNSTLNLFGFVRTVVNYIWNKLVHLRMDDDHFSYIFLSS
jgi:hypothetical protein